MPIVPTHCVGMQPVTLCVTPCEGSRSGPGGIPTQSVGTIIKFSRDSPGHA